MIALLSHFDTDKNLLATVALDLVLNCTMTLDGLNDRLLEICRKIENVERGCESFFSEFKAAAGCELQFVSTETFNKPRITKQTLSVLSRS